MTAAVITPILIALFAALKSLGIINLTPEQESAIVTLGALVVPLALAWLARNRVWADNKLTPAQRATLIREAE